MLIAFLLKRIQKGDFSHALKERPQRYQYEGVDQISNVLIKRYKGT